MRDYYEKTKWFSIYTKGILPIFAFLNVLSLISSYAQADFSNADSILFVIGFLLDIIFVVLTVKTTIDITGEESWSVKLLIVLFGYNWIYRSICVCMTGESEYLLGFIIAAVLYSVYYIPNIVYFYHRRDYFLKPENITNIKKKKDIEIKSANITDKTVWIACKVCGKTIPYNKNETCENCHKRKEDNEIDECKKEFEINNENIEKEAIMNEEMLTCKNCGKTISKSDLFCCYCGYDLQKNMIEYCTKCGSEVKKDWKFCKSCGEKIEE